MIMLYAYLTFASPEPQKEMVVIERDVTKLPENAFKNWVFYWALNCV